MNLGFIDSVRIIEYFFVTELLLLAFVVVFSVCLTIFFRIKDKSDNLKLFQLNRILINLISQGVDDFEAYTPKNLLSLPLVVKAIENYEEKIKGPFWSHLKEMIIHDIFTEEITVYLKSSNFLKKSIALRAVILAPHVKFTDYVIPLLYDKKPIIRFAAVNCSVKIGSQKIIEAVMDAMGKERTAAQYPYRDSLLRSNEQIHEIIYEKYLKSQNPETRASCLKVLSLKMGYLETSELEKDLHSENEELRWWATKALVNLPSEKTVDLLIQKLEDHSWQVRTIATHHLGCLQNSKVLPYLSKNLSDKNFWIRLNSAAALKRLGNDGQRALEEQSEKLDPEAYHAAKFVLDVNVIPYEKLIPEFRLDARV